jgi:hypothetical protein
MDIGVNLALLYMLDKEYKNAYKIYQILSKSIFCVVFKG